MILLDLRMPGLDGIGIVEVLRTWGTDTPILMISGFGTIETAVGVGFISRLLDRWIVSPALPTVTSDVDWPRTELSSVNGNGPK